jgi:hypothetical protein
VARRRWCHKRRSSSRSPAAPSRSCDNSPQPGPCSDTAPPSRVAPAMMPSPAAPGRSATTGTTCPCGETARVVLETSKPPKKGRNANRTSKMVTSGPQCDVSHTSSSVQLHSITGRGRQWSSPLTYVQNTYNFTTTGFIRLHSVVLRHKGTSSLRRVHVLHQCPYVQTPWHRTDWVVAPHWHVPRCGAAVGASSCRV